MNDIILWAVLIAVLIVIELMTVGLTSLWFAIGALFALTAAIFDAPLYVQLIIFIVVSVLSLFITRPILVKKMKLGKEKTNIDTLIGEKGIVIEKIDEFETGLVKINGQIWTAKSFNGSGISQNEIVIVDHIEGVKLIVKKQEE